MYFKCIKNNYTAGYRLRNYCPQGKIISKLSTFRYTKQLEANKTDR